MICFQTSGVTEKKKSMLCIRFYWLHFLLQVMSTLSWIYFKNTSFCLRFGFPSSPSCSGLTEDGGRLKTPCGAQRGWNKFQIKVSNSATWYGTWQDFTLEQIQIKPIKPGPTQKQTDYKQKNLNFMMFFDGLLYLVYIVVAAAELL